MPDRRRSECHAATLRTIGLRDDDFKFEFVVQALEEDAL